MQALDATAMPPLCVDLDGTLVKGDTSWMAWKKLCRKSPMKAMNACIRGLAGTRYAKAYIAEHCEVENSALKMNEALLSFLLEEKRRGRKMILVTGANERAARRIVEQLKIFDEVIGSSETQDMTGKAKARVLVDRFGERGFSYVGNAMVDRHVWRHAAEIFVAGSSFMIGDIRKKALRSFPF